MKVSLLIALASFILSSYASESTTQINTSKLKVDEIISILTELEPHVSDTELNNIENIRQILSEICQTVIQRKKNEILQIRKNYTTCKREDKTSCGGSYPECTTCYFNLTTSRKLNSIEHLIVQLSNKQKRIKINEIKKTLNS